MAFNFESIKNKVSEFDFGSIKDNFDKYIVRPANSFGLGGFVFDVEGESTVRLTTEITDHYTENNVAIQDHIAVRPKVVVLKSYVGELVHRLDDKSDSLPSSLTRKLTILNSYLPQLSTAAQQAKSFFESSLDNSLFDSLTAVTLQDAADLWGLVKNLTRPITRQNQAYMYFKALAEQKILVSVETPFEYMTNMAVESVIGYSPEDTQDITDFTITLKQIRFASTQTVPFDENKYQSRTKSQAAPVTSGGKVQGLPTSLEPSPIPPPSSLPPQLSLDGLPKISVAPVSQKAISLDLLNRVDPTGYARKALPF